MEKEILAVRRGELFGKSSRYHFNGFLPLDRDSAAAIEKNIREHGIYGLGKEFENNPEYKQIATYCVLVNSDSRTVFTYRRAGKEKRLKNIWSLGLGGHVRKPKEAKSNPIKYNVEANIQKEVTAYMHLENGLRPVGYINYDDSSVNRDHLGVLYFAETHSPDEIHARSREIARGRFRDMDRIKKMIRHQRVEEWSELVFKLLKDVDFDIREL